jgi:heat shock protein HslJ
MYPRVNIRRTLPAAAVAAALLLAACGDDDGGSGDTVAPTTAAAPATTAAQTTVSAVTLPAPVDTLDGSSWVLDLVKLEVADSVGVVATISFAGGSVSGSAGCNNFTGTYTATESELTFGPLATTQMACPPAQTAVETIVLERLAKVAGYTTTETTLTLTDAAGATLLEYTAAPNTVEGAWEATGYLKADGSAFTSVVLDTTLTAVFGADGNVAGSGGCNNFTGGYTIQGGTILAIGPLASTRKLCTEPEGIMDQETDYLTALQASVSFTNDGTTLTLFNAAGQRTVTFAHAMG